MSRMAELGQSLLTQEELFHDVLSARPAPDDLAIVITADDVDIDADPAAAAAPRRLSAPRRRTSFAGNILSGLSLCCACFRRKHAAGDGGADAAGEAAPTRHKSKRKQKKNIKRKASNSGEDAVAADGKERAITYIDSKAGKQNRQQRDRLLRARLLKSKRYAAYIKECHAALLARLTSAEGKQLIRKMAEDEAKPVPEVVEALVKGLQEHAIREYIRRLQAKAAAGDGSRAAAAPAAAPASSVMPGASDPGDGDNPAE